MKKFTSTLFMLLACLYLSAQTIGQLDGSFNITGFRTTDITTVDDNATAMAIQNDGKAVVVGWSSNEMVVVTRYNVDGSLDAGFGSGGKVSTKLFASDGAAGYGIAIQPNGKIVIVGWDWATTKDFAVIRLNADGSFDTNFDTDGKVVTSVSSTLIDEARCVAIQSDGKIVVGGFVGATGSRDFVVVRYSSDGSLDGMFGSGGIVIQNINGDDVPESIAINNNDGSIYLAGTSNVGSSGDFAVLKLDNLGVPVSSFGANGIVTTDINTSIGNATALDDAAHGLAIQSDGKIVVVGRIPNGANGDVAVVRYTANGALDTQFDGDGIAITNYRGLNSDDEARSVAVQSDGRIVVAGSTSEANNGAGWGFMVLRYNSNGTPDNTFDGDGKADADLTATYDIAYSVKLFSNRIFVAGYTGIAGGSRDFAVAVFQSDGSPLPLSLTQFYAQKQTGKVILQWQTKNEENVASFVIERSTDGKTYKAIGQVTAAGNSAGTQNYSFADASPFTSTNNYYRLLMVDADGDRKYSKILIIKFSGDLNLQIFPNPVKDNLQVQLPGGLNGNISLQIVDLNGRVLKQSHFTSDGSALSTTFDVSNLVNGVYIFRAISGNDVFSSKFVKQ